MFNITPLDTPDNNRSYLDEAGVGTHTHDVLFYPGSPKDWQPDTQSLVTCLSFAKYNYIGNQMLTLSCIDTEAAWSLMAQLTSKYYVWPMPHDLCADDTQIQYWHAKYLCDIHPLCPTIPLETAGSGSQQILTHESILDMHLPLYPDPVLLLCCLRQHCSPLWLLSTDHLESLELPCGSQIQSHFWENTVIMGNSTIPICCMGKTPHLCPIVKPTYSSMQMA